MGHLLLAWSHSRVYAPFLELLSVRLLSWLGLLCAIFAAGQVGCGFGVFLCPNLPLVSLEVCREVGIEGQGRVRGDRWIGGEVKKGQTGEESRSAGS